MVWHSASQRKPSCAVEPQHPVDARAERVAVDDHRVGPLRAAACPRAQASVVAPAPPEPPITPTTRPRRRAPVAGSVSVSTTQASERGSSATSSAPRASATRKSSVGGRGPSRPRARRRGARGRARRAPAARSPPTSTTGGRGPARAARRRGRRRPRAHPGGRGQAQQLVAQGGVGGDEQGRGHATHAARRRSTLPDRGAHRACGRRPRRHGLWTTPGDGSPGHDVPTG